MRMPKHGETEKEPEVTVNTGAAGVCRETQVKMETRFEVALPVSS